MPSLVELIATFLRERARWDQTALAVVWSNGDTSHEITVKVDCNEGDLLRDQEYRFLGRWHDHPRYGRQFHANSFVIVQPHGKTGIIAYLQRAGEGMGFGPVRATVLWDHYGSGAVAAVRSDPLGAIQVLRHAGLSTKLEAMQQLSARLEDDAGLESCTLDLLDLLSGRGFYRTVVRECILTWGAKAAAVVRRNPYKLMRFRSSGFKRCDAMYLDLGLPPDRLKRQALAAWYAISRDTDGHTWFPASQAELGITQNIGGAEVNVEKALRLATRAKLLVEIRTTEGTGAISNSGASRWLAERRPAEHEGEIAEIVAGAMRESSSWPRFHVPGCSDHQRERLQFATRGCLGILGGGPGTGKTFTVAELVKSCLATIGLEQIAVGAPTGKAAVRVTETLAAHGIGVRARTWHSLLRGGVDGGFHFGRDNPLPYRLLISDESSMIDCDLMAAIFRARTAGTLMLLVGDVNQLPPVGHGAPLRDLIAAGLPYGELVEIKRNSGGIVEACHAIRQGRRWSAGDNLLIHENANHPAAQAKYMLALLDQQMAAGLDPIWDCQVLAAVNQKSLMSRQALNEILQRELNGGSHKAGTNPFRVADKIVCLKNQKCPAVEFDVNDPDAMPVDGGKEIYVANGELARVLEVEERLTIAELKNPRRVIKIPRGKADSNEDDADGAGDQASGTGCSWDLGYCLSVHKSQGSEWPVVLVMLDEYPGAKMVCSREWLYTGISRAKQQCHLIGKKATADAMCGRVAIWKRKTFLKERLLAEAARRELVEM